MQHRINQAISHIPSASIFYEKPEPPKTLLERMVQHHTPGASIAVIDNFEIDGAIGFGVCEAKQPNQVTPNTLFQVGSISKPVFALAVMRLVQEGMLDLDKDVNSYLTSWKVPVNGDWQPRVTLRHLLSHTAGTTVSGYYGYKVSMPLPTTVQILNGELPANSEKVVVNVIPGLNYRYSGGGMVIAQQVLMDVMDKRFPEMMRDLVFAPLGMENSTYSQPLEQAFLKQAATGHRHNGIPLEGKYFVYPEMAAAGLWSTPTDIAKLGIEMMRTLSGKPTSIWKQATIEEMLKPHSEKSMGQDGLLLGLGIAQNGTGEGTYFFHDGTNLGFVAMMRFYPHLGKGAVIMLNSDEGVLFRGDIMQGIGQAYEWPNLGKEKNAALPISRIDRYLGTYSTKSRLKFIVSNQDNQLFLQCDRQQPVQLFSKSELVFFSEEVNIQISFTQEDTGKISGMTLSQSDIMTLGTPEGTEFKTKKEHS
ncbi:beta-lactamase [Leptolyngbya sp. Heron Island J]|nr:beta-lactamase [Leptolyngbya sp. Heron Island J]